MLNKSAKFWLSLLILAGAVYLGAINVRGLIGNDLLNYDEFSFRTSIPPDEENWIFRMLSYTSLVIIIAYAVTFVSAIFFLKNCKLNLKENPWLLMCSILFFVFVPVEIYTSYLDLKFYLLFLQNPPNHDGLLRIFGERIGFLKGVPWIATLSYYSIIFISVYQPLKKTTEQLEQEKKKRDEEYSYKYFMHEEDDTNSER
ncbi:MAG: hypothetical protein NTV87_09340 [Ignavibacteriae bacterium]|nr:hypothetical protein [Ignavibacteriota bacterium]